MNELGEHIEDYFHNKLTAAEKLQFEKRCVEEDDFAKEVAFYVMTREATRQKLLDDKKQEWANYEQDNGNKKTNPLRLLTFNKWLPYAAAACLISFVALYFFYFSSTPRQLATNYFNEHLTQLSQTMNASRDSLQRGIAAYNNKDYKTALALFEKVHAAHPEQSDAIKYMGNVYLATKDYDKALKYFDELALIKGNYSNPGMFLKAVTLLMRNEGNDKAQAKELLEQVVNKKEEGSKAADEWLKKW